MSRTVVKPRISVSVASSPATRLLKPTSPLIDCAGVGRTSIACQWASISPGISVRPPPSIRVAPSAAIGSVEIAAMTFPWTSTFDGAESVEPVPSKMRTFSKRTSSAEAGPARRERQWRRRGAIS